MFMKKILKQLIRWMVSNKAVWLVLNKIILPPARYADWMRQKITATNNNITNATPASPALNTNKVLHGPFKGMTYKNDLFCCSAIPPKLLGSYEREIHHWIDEMLGKSYVGVVDVGCAEGYYAVGFATRMPNTPIFAYDINEQAREQCRKLAEANDVAHKVHLRSYCDPDELARVVDGRRFLVIADCEGYEKTLFNSRNRSALASSDILIEIHDFMDITILPQLRELFAETHKIREVESIDDLRKLDRYNYPELSGLDIKAKYHAIAEWRQRIMIWMYMEPTSLASTI